MFKNPWRFCGVSTILKPEGQAWLLAPLFYEEHEKPFDFHRYTQFAWRRVADQAGLELKEIDWLEGYFGTLSKLQGVDGTPSCPSRGCCGGCSSHTWLERRLAQSCVSESPTGGCPRITAA